MVDLFSKVGVGNRKNIRRRGGCHSCRQKAFQPIGSREDLMQNKHTKNNSSPLSEKGVRHTVGNRKTSQDNHQKQCGEACS